MAGGFFYSIGYIATKIENLGNVANFSTMTSYTAGSVGDLAGTVTSAGALTVTGGGAGTSATGQFISEITVIN